MQGYHTAIRELTPFPPEMVGQVQARNLQDEAGGDLFVTPFPLLGCAYWALVTVYGARDYS